ncbi:Ldh family oxidoreductase [Paracandidimonas soli]|uniref:Ldh family oxidoreductase n=1 Tax=Paracandidimonas soli TaxID=1917182 RepID=UPI00333FFF62
MTHTPPDDAASDMTAFDMPELRQTVQALFTHFGCDAEKAASIADALVEADAMGHDTHGLALAPWYIEALRSGQMSGTGDIEVISDRGGCVAWHGKRLPGAWLIGKAIDLALERIADHGVVTLTIAGSHHTGALAAYLPRITERGLLPILSCSGPAASGVAPYGGTRALFTPNPLAAGLPTSGDPILLDISASITTNNRARQLAGAGKRLPGPWVLDAQGQPSDDPAVAVSGGGTLLPVGGLDHGHKGYGMALLVEGLTQGLSGLGRHTRPSGVLMNIFLQIIDPAFFGGRDAFIAETSWLADQCRNNPPRPGVGRVRLPGDRAAGGRRQAMAHGVSLRAEIIQSLDPYLAEAGIAWPNAQ